MKRGKSACGIGLYSLDHGLAGAGQEDGGVGDSTPGGVDNFT